LRFTHHVKLMSSFWKQRARNAIALAALAGDLVHAPTSPSVHRRIDVAERELVGRELTVRMHVPLAQEQDELLLRELGIDARHRKHVEREIPGRVPRVLPLVRHRDHVAVVEMAPIAIAALLADLGRARLLRVAVEPRVDRVVIELTAPQESGVRLAHDQSLGRIQRGRQFALEMELVLALAELERAVERRTEERFRRVLLLDEAQSHGARSAGLDRHAEMHGALRSALLVVHRVRDAAHDVLVERVLDERARVGRAEHALVVRLVLGEQELEVGRARSIDREAHAAERRLVREHRVAARAVQHRSHATAFLIAAPAPHVAEPERRQEVQHFRVGSAVRARDADQDVVGSGLGVLDLDVEVAALVEHAGVAELELGILLRARAILLDEPRVRELGLRILVQAAHVGVRRRRVEVEVLFLHVLAVIALGAAESEQALLQDRIAPVPQRDREAQARLTITDAEDPVLAPAISATARVIVREVVPRVAVGRVILAHRAPLSLGEVRTPALPVVLAPRVFEETLGFGIECAFCASALSACHGWIDRSRRVGSASGECWRRGDRRNAGTRRRSRAAPRRSMLVRVKRRRIARDAPIRATRSSR
jgi:hypothetical protein